MKKILAILLALSMGCALCAVSASADAKPFEGQKLTVLYMSGVYADAAKAMKEEFEEATGAAVEIVDMPYTELHEKILLDATAGAGTYDVVDVASQWDGEFAPFMTDLAEFIERDGYDTSVFIENVLNNCGVWQGEFIGIPNASTPQLFAYRTDIFPDGLADRWDHFRYQLAAVTDAENGFYGDNISGIFGQLGGVFDYILWSKGGNWADEDWNVTIDCPEAREALEHLKALNDEGIVDPNWLNWGTDESIQAFLRGDSAVCETWPTLGLTQAADDPAQSAVCGKWALSVIPTERTGLTLLSAWDVSIPFASQNKELAWEWIKMYTSFENQVRFYDDYGILSPRKAFWELPGNKGTYMDTVREALDTANMWWRVPASTEVDTMLNIEVSAYISGMQDLETTITNMKNGIEQALTYNPVDEGIKNFNH